MYYIGNAASKTNLSRKVRKRTYGKAKIQISLRIRAVGSEYFLDAIWIFNDAKFFHADNEDSNLNARVCRLI